MTKGRSVPPSGQPLTRRDTETQIAVSSQYGATTRRGLVELQLGDAPAVRMDPAKARLIAAWLMEAAEAAAMDAFLMHFLTTDADMRIEQASTVLAMFRDYRNRETITGSARAAATMDDLMRDLMGDLTGSAPPPASPAPPLEENEDD